MQADMTMRTNPLWRFMGWLFKTRTGLWKLVTY